SATLRAHVPDAAWRTCFQGVTPLQVDGESLVLGIPSSLAKERIESRYLPLIHRALAEAGNGTLDVRLEIHTDVAPDTALGEPPLLTHHVAGEAVRPHDPPPDPADTPSRVEQMGLNPRYTFDNFVTGASNRFAHAAALSVAETPARSYNPLFIYGSAGLGKTHLLHGIAHYVHQNYPAYKVRYVATEVFMNDFVDAIRTNTTTEFKRRYRESDVLLIDDIQFLENKEGLQEEFFHTFNSLHGANRQIVISSDRPPRAIATLEDRLRSRFEWGLITDIQPPDLETRLAILRKKAEREPTPVPPEVLEYIATHITDNIRELEGALIRVAAYASLNRAPLTLELAQQVLGAIISAGRPRTITPTIILEETAKMFGFTVDELQGKSRRRPLVTARQVGMYVCRELTELSYPAIAREFGGRDHTTVIHAVEKVGALMKERRQIYEQVSELIQSIKSGG
ncbi:MAG TPA: chromosomal replication initiator protein DnaA, partial [Actinomycetota bacterium]|nr:chromosomal replication initiator protein DnaA [Actinomycetota bacterium]